VGKKNNDDNDKTTIYKFL